MYTGQLFIREGSSSHQRPPGKRLIMVAGVIEVDETFPLDVETQYVVLGQPVFHETTGDEIVELNLFKRAAISLDDWEKQNEYYRHLKGLSIDGLLLSPIWRV